MPTLAFILRLPIMRFVIHGGLEPAFKAFSVLLRAAADLVSRREPPLSRIADAAWRSVLIQCPTNFSLSR